MGRGVQTHQLCFLGWVSDYVALTPSLVAGPGQGQLGLHLFTGELSLEVQQHRSLVLTPLLTAPGTWGVCTSCVVCPCPPFCYMQGQPSRNPHGTCGGLCPVLSSSLGLSQASGDDFH